MSEKKKTFVELVVEFLKVDDAKNIKSILAMAKKEWSKQIAAKERSIAEFERKLAEVLEEQEDYLTEAKDSLKEAYLNIDAGVKGRDDIRSYLSSYEQQIANAKSNIEYIEDVIDNKKSSVETAVGKLKREIDNYKENIKAIS